MLVVAGVAVDNTGNVNAGVIVVTATFTAGLVVLGVSNGARVGCVVLCKAVVVATGNTAIKKNICTPYQ